jgi:hypothetical protein
MDRRPRGAAFYAFFLDLRAKPGVKALSTYATASWVANRNIKEGE